jgi:phosphopantetheinyl transferase
MPVIFEKTYENNTSVAVWEISETYEEIKAILPPEISDDAELTLIRHQQKRVQFLCSRLLINYLANSLGIIYSGIWKDKHGKPYLVDSLWQISLTHTLNFVAAAINPKEALGLDIEKPSEKIQRVATKFLSEKEILEAKNDAEKLCKYWCAKEAIYKLYGKKKVIVNQNIYVFPFEKEEKKMIGHLKINNIDKRYNLYIEKISGYILVVSGDEIERIF